MHCVILMRLCDCDMGRVRVQFRYGAKLHLMQFLCNAQFTSVHLGVDGESQVSI